MAEETIRELGSTPIRFKKKRTASRTCNQSFKKSLLKNMRFFCASCIFILCSGAISDSIIIHPKANMAG
jgi:hypothetical protein